jgi:hypothetical protein
MGNSLRAVVSQRIQVYERRFIRGIYTFMAYLA